MRADVLVPGTTWEWFIHDLKRWEELNTHLNFNDKITILRQLTHSSNVKLFDQVIGVGEELKKEIRFDLKKYQSPIYLDGLKFSEEFIMFQDFQRVNLKGTFIDIHHFLVGMNIFSSGKINEVNNPFVLTIKLIFDYTLGSRYSAATWAGDIGAAVIDCLLGFKIHYFLSKNPHLWPKDYNSDKGEPDPAYVTANSYDDHMVEDEFIAYYYESRVPEADLVGDILPWALKDAIANAKPKTKLHELLKKFGEDYDDGVLTAAKNQFNEYYKKALGDKKEDQNELDKLLIQEINYFAKVWFPFRQQSAAIIGISESNSKKIHYLTEKMYNRFKNWFINGNY